MSPRPSPIRIVLIYAVAILFFLGAIPYLVVSLGVLVDATLRLPSIPLRPLRLIAGAALVAMGLGWIVWTNVTLLRLGRGHPQEVFGRSLLPSTERLVAEGPFRRTRNPMVLGGLLMLEGLSILVGSASAALLTVPGTAAIMMGYHRRWEEPALVARFGADCERYRERVPMLLPWRKKTGPDA